MYVFKENQQKQQLVSRRLDIHLRGIYGQGHHVDERRHSPHHQGGKQGPFESASFLERLDASYDRLADLLRKRHRVRIVELEGAEAEPETAAERVEELCRLREQEAATV